jgi:hypothetical protein
MARVMLLAVGMLVLSGCLPFFMDPSYMSAGGRTGEVRKAADHFGADLRWSRFEQASARVDPEAREAFRSVATQLLGNVRFTGFEIESVELGETRGEATVSVAFTLYVLPLIEEFTIRERQKWYFERSTGQWMLEPDLELYRSQLDGPEIAERPSHRR